MRMELRRADIGFGRVIVDDTGVTRRGLFRTRHIAFADVISYRLRLMLVATELIHRRRMIDNPITELEDIVNTARGKRGQVDLYAGIELASATGQLAFNWRFAKSEAAVAAVLRVVRPRILERVRAELAATGVATFGPLAVRKHAVQWRDHTPLAAPLVEAIELFDVETLDFRIMQRDRAFPYASAALEDVPNADIAFELANELGYVTRGNEMFQRLRGS